MNPLKIIGKVEQQARAILYNKQLNRIVLGLSGGADSVALLRILLRQGFTVFPAHCNFHLRGAEADRDTRFCQDLCDSLGIGLDIVHFDVPAYESEHGVSTEIACRELRYAYFREALVRNNAQRIAVAHHADDNIETMLLNLFRGSGISGLRGMLPDANDIIRPLLTTTRAEILEYLEAIGQDYIVDSSNLCSDYRRNYIRNELLPAIESRWAGARKAITNTIGNLQADERALKAIELNYLDLEDPQFLPYDKIREAPDAQWVLHRWLSRFGCRANVAREIAAMMRVSRPETGKKWKAFPGTVTATRKGLEYSLL